MNGVWESMEISILVDIAICMRCSLLFLLVAFGPVCYGQKEAMVLHLRAGGPVKGLDSLPFGEVTVFDGRFDQSNIGVTQSTVDKTIFELDEPLKGEVETFLGSVIGRVPHGEGRLLLNFRRLRQMGGPFGFVVQSDAYLERGDGRYEMVGTMFRRRNCSLWGTSMNEKYNRALRGAMVDILRAAADSCRVRRLPGALYPVDSAESDVFYSWERRYVIAKANHLKDGVFHSFADFQENRVYAQQCLMNRLPDSSYTAVLTKEGEGEVTFLCADDTLYYDFLQQYWLPIDLNGGRFSFYVPTGLPDIAPRELPPPNTSLASPSGNRYADVVGLTMAGGMDMLHDAKLERARRAFFRRWLGDMKGHWFYLDLDTGEWVRKDTRDTVGDGGMGHE